MDEDPVIKELHKAKDRLARRYSFSAEALGQALIKKQKTWPRKRAAAALDQPVE